MKYQGIYVERLGNNHLVAVESLRFQVRMLQMHGVVLLRLGVNRYVLYLKQQIEQKIKQTRVSVSGCPSRSCRSRCDRKQLPYLPRYLLGTSQQYCECLIIRIDVLMKEGMIGEGGRRL